MAVLVSMCTSPGLRWIQQIQQIWILVRVRVVLWLKRQPDLGCLRYLTHTEYKPLASVPSSKTLVARHLQFFGAMGPRLPKLYFSGLVILVHCILHTPFGLGNLGKAIEICGSPF